MSDQFAGTPTPDENYIPLAQWLSQLLQTPPLTRQTEPLSLANEDIDFANSEYHADFYPQIPDFALALLKQDPTATTRYAPLLFHLIGCPACHHVYLETYDALATALDLKNKPVSTTLRAPAPSLAATSPRLLVLLCQLLIGQAQAVLRQARREHDDQDAWARSLLQQAIQVGSSIMQGTLRQRALRELVAVASLYATEASTGPAALSYASLVSSGNGPRGRRVRRAETVARVDEPGIIELRSGSLEGRVTQEKDLLILHLAGLEPGLQGKSLVISIPLGTLLEPIRWLGGNPYAIRGAGPVGADGTFTTPLGRTDLFLSNPEDRNLLETLFKKLDIHPVDELPAL
jgi:hypothetical protein